MKTCGLIVEYNPFHNGHIYHIEQAKKLTNCECIIAVMSGNYCQRGIPAIIDKHTRAKEAIKCGINIVVELPYIYATQSASMFAKGAIDILKLMNIDYLCFGSETNNLEELIEIANTNINVDKLKEMMKTGISYPEAYGLLASSMGPNDILACAYLKQLKSTNIKPISIKRTIGYHDQQISDIASASAIRNALFNQESIQDSTPMKDILNNHELVFIDNLFPYVRHLLLTMSPSKLAEIFMFSEGIENHLIKQAKKYFTYDDFISNATTRRYTTSRINRCLLHLYNHITKEEVNNLGNITNARIIAFDEIGQQYLKTLKASGNIASNFEQYNQKYAQMELKTSYGYSNLLSVDNAKKIIKNELRGAQKIII